MAALEWDSIMKRGVIKSYPVGRYVNMYLKDAIRYTRSLPHYFTNSTNFITVNNYRFDNCNVSNSCGREKCR